ncbi:hypothetical protein Taro_027103 [Colocasia esculenta]|uniref:Protein kinase domain-containing protein n=1 Tax=Colocasia esculenta TaxID=4460 RepID=A0A843VLJ0_COLES|nr:hypothetical protein [Colocasia esculenta]
MGRRHGAPGGSPSPFPSHPPRSLSKNGTVGAGDNRLLPTCGCGRKWGNGYPRLLLLVLVSLLASCPGSRGQRWDGVVITLADYQGLQAFKHALVDPRGFLRSWNGTGLDACSGSWTGIKCVQGKVISIQLPWKGLGGSISEKIGQLTSLRKLSLHDNVIGGQVPAALGFLPDLRGVYLFNNRLSGSIPHSIGHCLVLQTLDLSNNSLTGAIPDAVSNSTRLYRLNLSYNNFSGSIPLGLTRSSSLKLLSLHHSNLSGSIPNTWGVAGHRLRQPQLQILNLDHNSFTGSIPPSLSQLTMLQVLTITDNRIKGTIPADLGALSRLQTLDAAGNSLTGPLPPSLCNLSSLVQLNLDHNRLQGQLPVAIDGLKNISVLSLKGNQFQGPIPVTIGNISSLSLLDLSENNFTGEIPASLVRLTNLTSFNVSDNDLSGPVPFLLSEKFNSSSFRGNLQLCGYSASVPCPTPPSPNLPITQSPSPTLSVRKLHTKDVILLVAGAILVILLVLCCALLCCLLKKRSDLSRKSAASGTSSGGEKPGAVAGTEVESGGDTGGKLVHFDGPLVFTADDLLCATAEIMGKSTYGTVYKATLEDSNQVAVKRLREKIAKGQKEFEAEVNLLGKIRHPNLLALRAYYLGPKGEKLLVFDYMPKGSLAAFLHARGPDTPIEWPTRMNIAMGTTRGLHYLHTHENMVHGNLTSGNILLDEHTTAKISDYGLSRLMTPAANSNVIATAGALGYRAPELSKLKKANTKTDVYSLGVIMLELLTGKSPGEAMNGVDLPQWVASIVKEEWTNEVFDLELIRDSSGTTGDELLNTLKLALHCVDPSPAARPEVQEVLHQLGEIKPGLAGATDVFPIAKPTEEGAGAAATPDTATGDK